MPPCRNFLFSESLDNSRARGKKNGIWKFCSYECVKKALFIFNWGQYCTILLYLFHCFPFSFSFSYKQNFQRPFFFTSFPRRLGYVILTCYNIVVASKLSTTDYKINLHWTHILANFEWKSDEYSMHPLHLLQYPLSKNQFKLLAKKHVIKFWEEQLHQEVRGLSSLCFFNPPNFSLQKTCTMWLSAGSNSFENSKALIVAKLLSGSVPLRIFSSPLDTNKSARLLFGKHLHWHNWWS